MMAMQRRRGVVERPFVPSEAWIGTFELQLSEPNFLESMRGYARRRARLVARYRNVDDGYASDLVQDVLDDTLEGVLTWDPARVDLRKHVLDAIKSRSRHDYVHAKRYRHESFSPEQHDASLAAVEHALAEQQARELRQRELAGVAATILEQLRILAEDDYEVLLLLDAYVEHVTKKEAVIGVTGLTHHQYDAARKRLHRLLDRLPSHLRNAAR